MFFTLSIYESWFPDGDARVLEAQCRKITDIRFFQWGTVYVLETSQGVLVKRVQESVDHADSILCVSENSSVHHPFLLPRDDIRSLSTIVGLVRLV